MQVLQGVDEASYAVVSESIRSIAKALKMDRDSLSRKLRRN